MKHALWNLLAVHKSKRSRGNRPDNFGSDEKAGFFFFLSALSVQAEQLSSSQGLRGEDNDLGSKQQLLGPIATRGLKVEILTQQ